MSEAAAPKTEKPKGGRKPKPALPPEPPRLAALRELAGVPPVDDKAAVRVDITRPISDLARELGALLHPHAFFRMGERLVEVDDETGDVETMDADAFRSRIEDYAVVGKPREAGFIPCSMSRDTARAILVSRHFRKALRTLHGVNKVRLPVWDAEGKLAELLPAGYHAASGIYTVDTLPYPLDMDASAARAWLLEYFEECRWAEPDAGTLEWNRNFCAHLVCMMTVYLLEMFPPTVARMGFFYTANQRSAGKSTIAESALAPVHGEVTAEGWGRDDERVKKDLDTAALENARYLFLDNVTGKIASSHLARFITSASVRFRMMGTHKSGVGENRRVVILTGNGARTDADMESRLLPIQLHVPCDAVEDLSRKRHPITKAAFTAPEMRRKFLAALWALVDHWNWRGCPRASRLHTRFQQWEGVVGGVLECAQMGNAFAKPAQGMDDQGEAWAAFFPKLAAEMETIPSQDFSVGDCLELARASGLLDDMLPGAAEMEARKLNHAFGTYVRRRFSPVWEFTSEQGRRCEFRRKPGRGMTGSLYTVTIVDMPAE